jgi:uncharacterized membrane protein
MVESIEEKQTERMEAFSDGVFAFAITLLVLNLKEPSSGSGTLFEGFLGEWPTFFALVTSFVTILIMWLNHHNMFNYIRKIDTPLMLLNGFLLFFVVLTPFTTSLVADYIRSADASEAAVIYSLNFVLLAAVWNVFWRYASGRGKLLGSDITEEHIRSINRSYRVGPALYVVAFVVAFFSGIVSVSIILLAAGYFAVTATIVKTS